MNNDGVIVGILLVGAAVAIYFGFKSTSGYSALGKAIVQGQANAQAIPDQLGTELSSYQIPLEPLQNLDLGPLSY